MLKKRIFNIYKKIKDFIKNKKFKNNYNKK